MNGIKSFSKKSEMNLLFAQSLEFQTLYSQAIDSFHTSKYFLLPKQWLDGYKEAYNYNLVKPKSDKYTDYNSFKSDLLKENPYITENINNSQNNDFPIIQKDIKKLDKYQIEYPVNFYPVKEEIFQNSPIDKNEYLYELIVGENNIFVIDNKSNKNIFICSLENDSADLDDFVVNVDYIITYKNENLFKKEMMKHIIESKGFAKYCKERNLDINKREEQEIFDKEMDKLGIFIVVNNNNDDKTPTQFLINYAEKKIDNQNIVVDKNSFGNNNLNILNTNSEQIDFKTLSLGEFKNNLGKYKKNNNNQNKNNVNNEYNNEYNNENNFREDIIINNNNQNNINYNQNFFPNNFGGENDSNFNQINIQNNNNQNFLAEDYSNIFINSNNLNPNFHNNNSNNYNPNIQNNNLNMNDFNKNINPNINNLNVNPLINVRNVKKVIYYFPGDIYYHIKNKSIINKSYLDSQTYTNKNNIINHNPQNLKFIPNNNYNNFQNNKKFGNNYMGNNRNNYDFNNMIGNVNCFSFYQIIILFLKL